MTDSSDDVPPASKSQKTARHAKSGGNTRGSNSPLSRLATVEQLLLSPVEPTINGEQRRMTTLAAIMYRLIQKSHEGDKKARRAVLKFERFAQQHSSPKLEVVFVDNDYLLASPGANTKKSWEEMRSKLNLSVDYLMLITDTSTGPRHGDATHILGTTTTEIARRAWTVFNRFLEYKKRGSLEVTEFPIL